MRRLKVLMGWPESAAVALILVWVLWAAIAAALAGNFLALTSPYVVAPVALVAGVVLGRLVAPYAAHRATGVSLLALTAGLLLPVVFAYGAAKGPLFYANANAALAVQFIALCGLVMVRTSGRRRAVAGLGAVLGLWTAAANYSMAGFAVAVPLLAVVVAMTWRPARHRAAAIAAATFGFITVASSALAVALLALSDNWPAWVLKALDPARKKMWQDAVKLWERHPVVGGGPGTYEEVSRLGYDPDTATAHSSVLQIGAETGWVGVALFGMIVIAGLVWACRSASANAVIGTAAWTALLVHSFADHLLEFVPVMLAAGLVLGWAGSQQRQAELVDAGRSGLPALR